MEGCGEETIRAHPASRVLAARPCLTLVATMSLETGRRETHTVENQAPPLVPYNVFDADTALREAIEREGGAFGLQRLSDAGAAAGSEEALEHSERCERNEPRLIGHDRYGNRVGRVELDPSWHWLLREAPSSARSTRCRGATRAPARTSSAPG
jgi:Adaptive response protein AidB N-terminal domain